MHFLFAKVHITCRLRQHLWTLNFIIDLFGWVGKKKNLNFDFNQWQSHRKGTQIRDLHFLLRNTQQPIYLVKKNLAQFLSFLSTIFFWNSTTELVKNSNSRGNFLICDFNFQIYLSHYSEFDCSDAHHLHYQIPKSQ